ncbi:uncharacterized protein LOC133820014 [Humulus lupulus]|uniref:uncharacterized protein LOC133820014 n=1 Tax=Humulus lupulus TaxID=3486 RepID=UPI002B412508|nr:uncharacterized protein LOC133820014 [Humulus lupulus]
MAQDPARAVVNEVAANEATENARALQDYMLPTIMGNNIEVNPKEQCNEISLRSGKMIDESTQGVLFEERVSEKKKEVSGSMVTNNLEKHPQISIGHHIKIPYLQRLQKSKLDKQFFKKLEKYETVALTNECNAIFQRKLPPKFKDPRSFNIPCSIGDMVFERALCDLGDRVNTMPLSNFQKMNLGEARPTTVILQMADWSITHPRGVIENVLVKVDRFIFLADFIIFYMEEDKNIPIILGRSFLATGRALIDVQKGELKL